MGEQTGYRVKRVEKKKNRKRAKNRPKPGKSFEREDLENAFEITLRAHRIRTKEEREKIKNEPEDYFGAKISSSDSEHSSTDEPKPSSKPGAKPNKVTHSKTKQ